ncbi:hypothetical protein evm_015622 [Chilo suppressalis]|nr:hypothetical protein evm_015622 [Chilo suppressalis]
MISSVDNDDSVHLVILVGAHLLAREAGQVEALPEVVPGARVVVPLVRREKTRVDADLKQRNILAIL